MRAVLVGLLFSLISTISLGQSTTFYTDRALGVNPLQQTPTFLSYAQVRVCSLPLTTTSPCAPVAAITDQFGNSLSINGGNFGQLTTDFVGRFSFGCSPGNYQVQVAATGSNTPQLSYPVTCPSGTSLILGTANVWSQNQTFPSINKIVYVDGAKYAKSFAGLQQAITDCGADSACTEVFATGGTYDSAGSCLTIPKNLMYIHSSSFAGATLRINSDMDGFCPPSLTQNLRIEDFQILTNTGVVLTSNHAAIHLLNAPRPVLKNLLISTEATAGGCLLLENTGVAGNAAFGTWDGVIENLTCQRTSPNQGTPDTNLGHFGIYCKGQATGTNPDCSMHLFNRVWVENHGVGMQFDFANSNTVTRAHLLFNSINLKCVSCKDNFIIARMNQFRASGSPVSGTNEHYNFDSGSSDNILFGKLESPSTKGTDSGVRNSLFLGATDAWNFGSVVHFWPQSGGDPSGSAGSVFYRTDLSRLRVFDNALSVWQNIPQISATGSATVDLASVASSACTADSADVTLTGAAVGDPVRVTAATALPAGVFLVGRVTATNTGRFQLCNLSGGAVDRASDTYTISVIK
jgi:hypothetical protein